MATTVKISCKYYQVREVSNDEVTERTYSLIPWISDINEMGLEERFRENINGVSGRLEEVHLIQNPDIYSLNFMRTDNISTSYKVKKDEPAEHIDIEVGEYIAKNTVCLYDATNNIIMIQSNRGGYTETSIESYINSFFEQKECALLAIKENINITGEDAEFTKFDIRLANISEYRPLDGTIFEGIVDGMNKINGVNVHIEISMGNNRKKRLNPEVVKNAILDLHRNRGCVNVAKVRITDDKLSGIYDIFDNFAKDEVKMQIKDDDKGNVAYDKLAFMMKEKYLYEGARERVQRTIHSI